MCKIVFLPLTLPQEHTYDIIIILLHNHTLNPNPNPNPNPNLASLAHSLYTYINSTSMIVL